MATEEKPQHEAFRAIIVGGGPVALTAALAFDQAGIDYVVLERRAAFDHMAGASIAVYPHNVRLLDQLGLLKEAEATYMPVKYKRNLRRDGAELGRNNMLEAIGLNHGHPWMCFHRAKLMTMLRNKVHDPAKILLNKEVVSIECTPTGATVTCADSSSYKGSIVIGADGVRSTVRRLMNDVVARRPPAEPVFQSTYLGLYGCAARSPNLAPETLYEVHGADLTIQLIVAEGQQHFLVYRRLTRAEQQQQQQQGQQRKRYTEEDMEALVREVGDVRFRGEDGEWVSLGQIWGTRMWSAMDVLEEGTVARWHEGRCVLVGDAAHKMTPNIGFGMNSGMQDVAQLVNRLHALLLTTTPSPSPTTTSSPESSSSPTVPFNNPDTASLECVFAEYQSSRASSSREAVGVSGLYTRLVAWSNPVWRLADQYVLPYLNGDIVALGLLLAPIVRKGVVFDFLEERGFRAGKYAYYTSTPSV